MNAKTFARELARYRPVRKSDFQGATCSPRSRAAMKAAQQPKALTQGPSSNEEFDGLWAGMCADLEKQGKSKEEAAAAIDRLCKLHQTHVLNANLEQIEEELAALASLN